MKKTIKVVMMTLMVSMLMGCGRNETLQTIKIGVLNTVDSVPLYIAEDDKLYEQHGLNVELVEFSSASNQSKALEAGEIDVVMTDMVVQSLLTKGGCPMKTILIAVGERVEQGQFMVVSGKQSEYASKASIEGAKIAISEGTMIEFLLDSYCEELGINPDEVEKVTVPSLSLRMEMLLEGKDIDMALLPEPLAQYTVMKGGICKIDDTKLDTNLSQTVIAFRQQYIDEHRDNVEKFVSAYNGAVKNLNQYPERYKERIFQIANVPEDMKDMYEDPVFSSNAVPDADLVERIENWMVTKKLLDHAYSYNDLVDESFIEK